MATVPAEGENRLAIEECPYVFRVFLGKCERPKAFAAAAGF
jgi:hypothetical protein